MTTIYLRPTDLSKNEKIERAKKFFDELCEELKDSYEKVESCNQDISAYLVPIGTKEEITYNSKPINSFRFSDHWNWYANIKKCKNEKYIQCLSVNVPYPFPRNEPGKATKPRYAIQIGLTDSKGIYHAVYGEHWSRKERIWVWIENDIKSVLKLI